MTGMRKLEVGKLGFLLAFNDAASDLDEYYMYFLIALMSFDKGNPCGQTSVVIATLLLAKEISSFFTQPLSGWFVDYTEKSLHLTLIGSGIFQLVSVLDILFWGHKVNITVLTVLFIAHEFSIVLNTTAIWKTIKYRCQLLFYEMGEEGRRLQERTIGSIGVIKEIFANAIITGVLAVTFAVLKLESKHPFDWARYSLIIGICVCDLIVILISLTITGSSLHQINSDVPLIGEEDLSEPYSVSRSWRERATSVKMWVNDTFWDGYTYLKDVFIALFTHSSVGFHGMMLALIVYTFTEVVEYPLTFAEAQSGDDGRSCSESNPNSPRYYPTPCTTDNLCHGELTARVISSFTQNLSYVIGAFLYMLFLVRCPPKLFYTLVSPVLSVIIGILIFLFVAPITIPQTIGLILLSIILVVPDYIEKYNFFFWTSVVDSKNFGFFYGFYGVLKTILHIATTALLKAYPELKKNEPEFLVLVLLCVALIIFHELYGVWMVFTKDYFWREKKDSVQIQEGPHF